MRLAIQEWLAPGATLPERLENIHRAGFQAIEVSGTNLPNRVGEIRQALDNSPVKISAICAGFDADLLSPDKERRRRTLEQIKESCLWPGI